MKKYRWSAALPLRLAAVLLCGQAARPQGNPFLQDSLPDGAVVIEAEDFHASVARNGIQWIRQADPTASGGAVMVVPDVTPTTQGLRVLTNYVTLAPRLDYRIVFNKTGLHYLVLRGLGPSSDDDSCHAGLDGAGAASSGGRVLASIPPATVSLPSASSEATTPLGP